MRLQRVKVEVSRFEVRPEALNRAISELRSIRISPLLAGIPVDEFYEWV